jgi:hypothetical protein
MLSLWLAPLQLHHKIEKTNPKEKVKNINMMMANHTMDGNNQYCLVINMYIYIFETCVKI